MLGEADLHGPANEPRQLPEASWEGRDARVTESNFLPEGIKCQEKTLKFWLALEAPAFFWFAWWWNKMNLMCIFESHPGAPPAYQSYPRHVCLYWHFYLPAKPLVISSPSCPLISVTQKEQTQQRGWEQAVGMTRTDSTSTNPTCL